MKQQRVVYTVIDGMGSEAFEQACASGRAPALNFLRQNGRYVRDSVAVFPTITPAATASLVTGEVPARHGIPGMCWYDRSAGRFVNYGQSPRSAIIEGESEVIHNWLLSLNAQHLNPQVATIHEQLGGMGLVSASINFMVFRGPHEHRVRPDPIERILFRKGLPNSVRGPKELYIADVVSGPSKACGKFHTRRGGPVKRMKAADSYAACVTRDLLKKRAADMILFYLHENDHHSHQNGPASQVDNLEEADKNIAHVLGTYGSWEATLQEVGFVVTADHSQSPISDAKDHIIDLHEVFHDFKQVLPHHGREPLGHREVAAAGNGRVGFVYLNSQRKTKLWARVVDRLHDVNGLDQIMWRDREEYVVRSERGEMRFAGVADGGVIDERGNRWKISGEIGVVDGVIEDATIRTPEYPLAMWRIKSVLDLDRAGDIVVTPKLTWDIKDLGGADHRGGGDHASLHAQDSMIPFLSTLAQPPARPSTVDVTPHIVEHFRRLSSR
ncbi:MAG: alkaline phosphatase family protein [Actinomycetota bacterium]|nr:alkaline phosphatase family protein [Actinomycetota bacterium]